MIKQSTIIRYTKTNRASSLLIVDVLLSFSTGPGQSVTMTTTTIKPTTTVPQTATASTPSPTTALITMLAMVSLVVCGQDVERGDYC